jgi:adenylosuccinate lyase
VVPEVRSQGALGEVGDQRPRSTSQRIDEIEAVTKHDVIAFLTHLADSIGPEARFVHQGMTQLRRARHLPRRAARAPPTCCSPTRRAAGGAEARAFEHKMTSPSAAATASMPSRPPSASSWPGLCRVRPLPRAPRRRAQAEIATCAISGAVGTFANIDPRVEEHVAAKLGLAVEPVSTQVIPRDRHAMFFATLGVIASSIERLAIEIRHLQRTEVLEAEEYFSPGQKGSSAMPHKRNPVLTENLTGLARIVRAPSCRRWRTSRCGTSATSRIPRSSAPSARTRP